MTAVHGSFDPRPEGDTIPDQMNETKLGDNWCCAIPVPPGITPELQAYWSERFKKVDLKEWWLE